MNILFIINSIEKLLAEQATIDQQQNNLTPRTPSSPQPQISPQIKNYVNSIYFYVEVLIIY